MKATFLPKLVSSEHQKLRIDRIVAAFPDLQERRQHIREYIMNTYIGIDLVTSGAKFLLPCGRRLALNGLYSVCCKL